MNVVEAYLKKKGQFIIIISGLSGCGKLRLAKNIARDFRMKIIDQYDYYKKDYNEIVTLPDGVSVINWYTDEAIDWDLLVSDVDSAKKNGVIVIGVSFPKGIFNVQADYHIHLNISKQMSLARRKESLEKYKDVSKHQDEQEISGTQTEKLIMNKLIFPYYLSATKNAEKIDKYVSVQEYSEKDDDGSELYDMVFDVLIKHIEDRLYGRPPTLGSGEKKTNNGPITIEAEMLDKPRYSYDENLDMMESLYTSKQGKFRAHKGDGPIKFYIAGGGKR